MADDITADLLYDTIALLMVVPTLKRPVSFLLDSFFPNIVVSDTEMVAIDVEVGLRRMSPFVSPMMEGKLVESKAVQTNVFKPAYIKDKRAPDLRRPVRRQIGERIGGTMTPAMRAAANLAYEMTDQTEMLTRRLEWMAGQALTTGTVLVQGEGYPPTLVNFGRDAALTIAKTGTAKWTAANIAAGNASPTWDIEVCQRMMLKKSGAKATDIVFTTSSWEGFICDPRVKPAIQFPSLGMYQLDPGPKIERGAIDKGKWGDYRCWVYNEWYIDDGSNGGVQNKEYPMIPDGTVIMCGPDLMGTRGFGVILDPEMNYANMPFAPKTWINKDPAQRFLMMQSSPIIIPSRVNASISITACDTLLGVDAL